MSFSVNQRRQESGVRIALVARQARILGMVLRQASMQVARGVLVGMGLALTRATAGSAASRAFCSGSGIPPRVPYPCAGRFKSGRPISYT